MAETATGRIVRFSNFEVDLQSGELRRKGLKVKLGESFSRERKTAKLYTGSARIRVTCRYEFLTIGDKSA